MNKIIEFEVGKIYRFNNAHTMPMFLINHLHEDDGNRGLISVANLPLTFLKTVECKRKNTLYVFLYDGQYYSSYDIISDMAAEEFV